MAQSWQPGTQYNHGDIVEFEGSEYSIIQPHRSQPDWAPTVTPALWGRRQGHSNNNNNGGNQGGNHQWQGNNNNSGNNNNHGYGGNNNGQQQQQPYQNNNQGQPQQHQLPQGGTYNKPTGQEVDISKEDEKKSWYDLDDEKKQKMQIGGGLLAGAAALGAGYLIYKKREDDEEEEKAQVWGLQNWLREAERRTQSFYQEGPRGPTTWILVQGKQIPKDAIVGGEEGGNPFYIARAYQDNGLQLGKASPGMQKGASIGYKDKNYELETYECLIGNQSALRWIDVTGDLDLTALGAQPVEGGRENNGAALYIAQAYYKTGTHPGKTAPGYGGAFIVYGSGEEKVKSYRVLCYA